MSRRLSFRGAIEPARGGGAVIALPANVAEGLGGVHRGRVTGTLNGVAFESSTMPHLGTLYLGVHKATREAAGVAIGDEVAIALTKDDRPRVVEVPEELTKALARAPKLRAAYDALSFTTRKELAESVATAKRPETRAARLDKVLHRLKERA